MKFNKTIMTFLRSKLTHRTHEKIMSTGTKKTNPHYFFALEYGHIFALKKNIYMHNSLEDHLKFTDGEESLLR